MLGMDAVRSPTTAELRGVSEPAVLLLFDERRMAEITRPRDPAEDVKAAAAVKAQETLIRQGYARSAQDTESLGIYYGFQVVFRPNMSPTTIGRLIRHAVPFAVNTPGDISLSPTWAAHYTLAEKLLARLHEELALCRSGDRECNLPTSLLAAARALGEAYFLTRAQALYPLLGTLGASELEEQAKTIIRAYIAQARDLPRAWSHVETIIQTGGLLDHGAHSALGENAARLAIAQPLLESLVHGQSRNWSTTEMISAHISQGPALGGAPPGGALPWAGPPAPAPPTKPAGRTAPPPTAVPPARQVLTTTEAAQGFRINAAGWRVHPSFFSGEFATPSGWLPPPLGGGPAPPPAAPGRGRAPPSPATSQMCIPVARAIVSTSSPFAASSPHACEYCKRVGHAQYECPRRFNDIFGRPLPGFLASGEADPSAWLHGTLVPGARTAMVGYLSDLGLAPHRKYAVTLDHIASATAPPLPPGS